MFAISVQDNATKYTTTMIIGCEDVANKIIELGKTSCVSFKTSDKRKVSIDVAETILMRRLKSDTDFIERIGSEVSRFI